MKKLYAMCFGIFAIHFSFAQSCATSGFDVCTNNSVVVTNFQNRIKIPANAGDYNVGTVYKYNNVTAGFDAFVRIDKIVNASLSSGVSDPSIDDDQVADETGIPGSHAALFAPRIAPDQNLTCTNRRGFVQFTVSFYQHTNTNTIPSDDLKVALQTLNFLHFDMDGFKVGSNGWFKEIGYVKKVGNSNPLNIGNNNSELISGGIVTDADGEWFLTYGSITEREGVSRCAEVIEKSAYLGAFSTITFRMGYDYKAPVPCSNANIGRPTRQYGSKFGCFSLPTEAPLPVHISSFTANYNRGTTVLNWTSQQELNINEYQVERSLDGRNFQQIGIVKAQNAASEQKYLYHDDKVPQGVSNIYYRLRIVELDNRSRNTNILRISISESDVSGMVVTPNPVLDHAQVSFTSNVSGTAELQISDITGKKVFSMNTKVQQGKNILTLNRPQNILPGMYMVIIVSGSQTYSSKLVF